MRGFRAALVVAMLILLVADAATAAPRAGRRTGGAATPVVQDYSSAHFLIHTDLPAREAQTLLRQLETELKLISTYWGRPSSGILECYVAKDIATWPPEILSQMEPGGLAKIREGAGVCIGKIMSSGDKFMAKCHVYAVARSNTGSQVPLHEAVHGYCQQTFGRTGPKWYAEGMAELGHFWVNNKKGVNAPDVVIQYLQKAPRRKLDDLIATESTTGGTWQEYCWWWSLCHLLENNPNYTKQFRLLGIELLTKKERDAAGFQDAFGPKIQELRFEYGLFLDHLQPGYRADLCAWDWNRKFFDLSKASSRTVSAGVQASRGWQPSGLTLTAGVEYVYKSSGTWRAKKDAEAVNAGGATGGEAKLVGIVMKDYKLGKEFELGSSGRFTAPSDGNLFLRCRLPWNQLADATGRVSVKFKIKGADAEEK